VLNRLLEFVLLFEVEKKSNNFLVSLLLVEYSYQEEDGAKVEALKGE